jgi:hypothetical protein
MEISESENDHEDFSSQTNKREIFSVEVRITITLSCRKNKSNEIKTTSTSQTSMAKSGCKELTKVRFNRMMH